MFDFACFIHGPECTDIFHILFIIIVSSLGLLLLGSLVIFVVEQIESIRIDRSRVETMYETYYRDRNELRLLREKVDQISSIELFSEDRHD